MDTDNATPLLLHACCGPCSLEPVRVLQEAGYAPTIVYANSNIHPREEYDKRLDTLRAWAADVGIPVVDVPYDTQDWEAGAGRVGDAVYARFGVVTDEDNAESEQGRARQARCRLCYRLRFAQAAAWAAEHGFTEIGTTLSVSPYQYIDLIREELTRTADAAGLQAHFEDYRPYYAEATKRSRALGMYRQVYCGCRFSEEESRVLHEARKKARAAAKAARKAAKAVAAGAEEGAEATGIGASSAEKAVHAH